jgi:hypothetical protein
VKRPIVFVIACLAISAARAPGQGVASVKFMSGWNDADKIVSGSVADDRQAVIREFLSNLWNSEQLGYLRVRADEIARVRISPGVTFLFPDSTQIQKASAATPVRSLFAAPTEVRYAVFVGDELRSSLTLARREGKWAISALGDTVMMRPILTALASKLMQGPPIRVDTALFAYGCTILPQSTTANPPLVVSGSCMADSALGLRLLHSKDLVSPLKAAARATSRPPS